MPALMTNAELTALLHETAACSAEARTLGNIARRAETLWADGYSVRCVGKSHYCVFSPEGAIYAVFISETPACDVFGSSCSCPCFEARKTCKHLQAVVNAIEEGAEGDARQDDDDDRYPEF